MGIVKVLWKILKYLLIAYLIYIVVFGILIYAFPVHASNIPDASDFHGNGPGPDRIALVESPRDAFSRRVEIIRSAKHTLDVTCHCAKSGETTDCFFAELIRAADRGVKVRVLFDGTVGGLVAEHKNIPLALLAHPNIEYREYNPIHLLKPWGWNVMLHDKFILADDSMLMLGGRNIGDEYFDPPYYKEKVTNDRDVVVLNQAAGTADSRTSVTADVLEYMEVLWNANETKTFDALSPKEQAAGASEQNRLLGIAEKTEQQYPDYYLPAAPVAESAVASSRITLLHNPVSDLKKEPVIGASVAQLLNSCSDVTIQTPYATANRYTLDALRSFAGNGTVDFLTNSTASSPNFPAFSNYVTQRKKFLDTGIQIHEYQSLDSIHGKSCTADERFSVVGSFNLDDRSLYIDTESVLVIDSPEFYNLIDEQLDCLIGQSATVGKENTYFKNADAVIQEVPFGKHALMNLVSVFSRIFQFLI